MSSLVTDPEEYARVMAAFADSETPSTASRSDAVSQSSVVTDPDEYNRVMAAFEDGAKQGPPPSEEEDLNKGSMVGDVLRTGAALGSSLLVDAQAGYVGLGTLADALLSRGEDFDTGLRRMVRDIQETQQTSSLRYTPGTVGARQNLQAIGEFFAPLAGAIETVSDNAADITFEFTGSPNLAGVAAAIPLVALEVGLPIKGTGAARSGVIRLNDADVRKAQVAQLNDPDLKYNGSVAEVKLNNKGKLVDDPQGIALVNNGISRQGAAVITNSNDATKQGMAKMVEVFEQGKGNDILAMSDKTTKVIGESIARRLNVLNGKRKDLGSRLQALVVDGPVGDARVNISSSLDPIMEILKSEGIKPQFNVNSGRLVLPKNWQKGTIFDNPTMAPSARAINTALDIFGKKTNQRVFETPSRLKAVSGITTVREAHQIKKALDEMIDATKLSQAGATQNTLRAIGKMRSKINDTLGQIEEYGVINRQLSQAIGAMQPFEKFNKSSKSLSSADPEMLAGVAGEAMRNLAGDSMSSVVLLENLSTLNSAMKDLKINLPDDPRALIVFRQNLMDNFNIDPRIPQSEVGRKAGGALVSGSIGNTFGAAHDVAAMVNAGLIRKEAVEIARKRVKAFNLIKATVSGKAKRTGRSGKRQETDLERRARRLTAPVTAMTYGAVQEGVEQNEANPN